MRRWGGSLEEKVAALYADVVQWHKAKGLKLSLQGKLTLARLRTSKDWPKLKAKAASTRHLLPYTYDLALRCDSGNVHDRRRVALCQILTEFYALIDREGRFFSDEAKEEVKGMGRLFNSIYFALSDEAVAKKQRLWKAVPKFHMFEHICSHQALT